MLVRLVVSGWLALLLAACAPPMNYVHPTADLTSIKRVAIVPLQNLTQEKGVEDKVMNIVAIEALRRGLEVVEFGEVAKVLRAEGVRREEGVISKDAASGAAARLNVQGFFVGSVLEYGVSPSSGSSYPEVCLTLKLVDAKSYAVVWEATHSVKGSTVMDRLFGIEKRSPSDLCRQAVVEMLDTLFVWR
ncbi:MAG: hypothetical protein AB7E47_00660 [Desulfovibrionaceae bacterium]